MKTFDNVHGRELNFLGAFVGIVLTGLVVFITVAPFFIRDIPQVNQRLIDQQQTMLQTVFIALASFLWGTSIGTRQKDSTIDTLAKTANTAGTALAANSSGNPDAMTLKPGEAANTISTFEGTEIIKEPILSTEDEHEVQLLMASGLTRGEAILRFKEGNDETV